MMTGGKTVVEGGRGRKRGVGFGLWVSLVRVSEFGLDGAFTSATGEKSL